MSSPEPVYNHQILLTYQSHKHQTLFSLFQTTQFYQQWFAVVLLLLVARSTWARKLDALAELSLLFTATALEPLARTPSLLAPLALVVCDLLDPAPAPEAAALVCEMVRLISPT